MKFKVGQCYRNRGYINKIISYNKENNTFLLVEISIDPRNCKWKQNYTISKEGLIDYIGRTNATLITPLERILRGLE